MSGYRWDPVFRVVPRNGGETIYWLTDRLTDVGSHTKITLRYVESMNIREDINRSLRPVVNGLRPEVEIECLITTMEDQTFLKEIEDALLLPNHYNVFLSLDGGCVEREVVLANVSNAEPIRGKTVIGATFKLAVRCVDLIPRKPAMMVDPGVGREHVHNGRFDDWSSATQPVGWVVSLAGSNTWNRDTAVYRSSLASIRGDCVASASSFQLTAGTISNLNLGSRYSLSVSTRGTASDINGCRLILRNLKRGRDLNSDGVWAAGMGFNYYADEVTTSWIDYVKFFKPDSSFHITDTYALYVFGNFMTNGTSIYYDDISLRGPVLRPGVATW